MGVRWTDDPQDEWLCYRFSAFIASQNTKATKTFFKSTFNTWHNKWPPIIPDRPGFLDKYNGSHELALADIRSKREGQIRSWFNNRQRAKGGGGSGSHGALRLTSTPAKVLAPVQAYAKYFYKKKLKPEVIRLWRQKHAVEDNTEYIGDDNPEDIDYEFEIPAVGDIPIGFTMKVVRDMWDQETEEVKAEVEKRRKVDAGPVEGEEDPARRQERLSKMQDYISSLNTTIQNLLANVEKETGMCAFVLVGGPVPAQAGNISCFAYSHGATTDTDEGFIDHHPDFQDHIMSSFAQFTKACYPPAVCDARALLDIVPNADVEPNQPGADDSELPPSPPLPPPPPPPQAISPPIPAPKNARPPRKTTKAKKRSKKASGAQVLPEEPAEAQAVDVAARPKPKPRFRSTQHIPEIIMDDSSAFYEYRRPIPALEPQVSLPPMAPTTLLPVPTTQFFGSQPTGLVATVSQSPPSVSAGVAPQISAPRQDPPTPENVTSDQSPTTDLLASTALSPAVAAVPPAVATAPPVQPAAPPAVATTPPVQPAAPPAVATTPPVQPITPPVQPATPVQLTTPPVQPTTPPTQLAAHSVQPVAHDTVDVDHQHNSVAPLIVETAMLPEWLAKAVKYLISIDNGPLWITMLKAFLDHEAALGYIVGAKYIISWTGVPDELTLWQEKMRQNVTKQPQINRAAFTVAVHHWWTCLQPDWRGPSLSRDVPADHSWRQFKVGGPNGLFLFVMCLSWLMPDSRDDVDFIKLVADVTWVLEQVDDVPASAVSVGRRTGRKTHKVIDPPKKVPTRGTKRSCETSNSVAKKRRV